MLVGEGILTRGLEYSLRLPIPFIIGNSGQVQISLSKGPSIYSSYPLKTLPSKKWNIRGKDFRSQLRGSDGFTPFSLP